MWTRRARRRCRAAHRRRHRPGHRRLRARARSSGRRSERAQLRRAADRHARRPRHLDAQHHQGHPRLAGAGGDLRRAAGRARGQRRHLHPLRQPHRRDGAGHQSRRRDAGGDRHAGARAAERAARASGRPARQPARRRRADDAMAAKQVNDAAAYIRSLAQLRGRNAEWAEQAVREAVSLPAERGAGAARSSTSSPRDVPDLLRQLDGRAIAARCGAGERDAGHRAAPPSSALEPDWRSRLLAVISRPEPRADADDDRHLRPALRVHRTRASCCPAWSARSACCSRCSRCRCCRSTTPGWR